MNLNENLIKKRGTWELFTSLGNHDLSRAVAGHIDKNGLLWLRLPESIICTDGKHLIDSHPINVSTELLDRNGFTNHDIYWLITSDKKLLSVRLADGSIEDHTHKLPKLDKAYWLWTSPHSDILIGIPGKLIRYDGQESNVIDVPQDECGKIHSANISINGQLWITSHLGLHYLQDGEFRLYEHEAFNSPHLWDFIVDDERVWIPTKNGLFLKQNDSVSRIGNNSWSTNQSLLPLLIDDEHNIWMTHPFVGAYCINETQLIQWPFEETPGSSWPRAIVQDAARNYWFIGVGNGLLRYNPNTLHAIKQARIEVAERDKRGRIWMAAASQGLLVYDNDEIVRVSNESHVRCKSISFVDEDTLCLTSAMSGTSIYRTKNGSLMVAPQPICSESDPIFAKHSVVDKNGCLWLAGREYLYSFKDNKLKKHNADDLDSSYSRGWLGALLCDSKGTLWVTSYLDEPIVQISSDGITHSMRPVDDNPAYAEHAEVSCLFEDADSNIWLGSNNGCVYCCPKGSNSFKPIMKLSKDVAIQNIRIDSYGTKWISTPRGLVVSDDTHSYTMTADCLLPSRFILATWEGKEDAIVIATDRGICEYRPNKSLKPDVFIARAIADNIYERPAEIRMSENITSLTIIIGASNMKSGSLKYQIRMLGLEDEWQDTMDEEIAYEHLPIGKYTFEARAIDQDLVMSHQPALLSIEVTADSYESTITELQNELKEAQNFAANIIQTIQEGIIILNSDRIIATANDAALKMLGYSEQELTGQTAAMLLPKGSKHKLDASGLLSFSESNNIRGRELELRTKDGKHLPILFSASRICDINLRTQGFVIVASDLTELKEMQNRLIHSQKTDSLGVLAGGIAHDFNNILNVMIGNTELILDEADPNSEEHKYLSNVIKAGHQASKLCSEMLTYSGKSRNTHKAIDLSKAVQHNVDLLRSSISRKIDIQYDLPDTLPMIKGDEVQIIQVILNLIINASEAIGDQQGSIHLSTSLKSLSGEELNSEFIQPPPPPGEYIVLKITDTGCGMDSDTRRKIFDPFFTTKFTGRGLGLAAVHGVIQSHGASLSIDSAIDKGSTFTISFPACKTKCDSDNPVKSTTISSSSGGVALIVDDEEAMLTLNELLLKKLNFASIKAVDGLDGLEKFEANINDIDLVLLDITMPRMDGIEAYARMRDLNQDIPIIICSGYSEDDIAHKMTDPKNLHFLHKPYTMTQLSEMVNAVAKSS